MPVNQEAWNAGEAAGSADYANVPPELLNDAVALVRRGMERFHRDVEAEIRKAMEAYVRGWAADYAVGYRNGVVHACGFAAYDRDENGGQ